MNLPITRKKMQTGIKQFPQKQLAGKILELMSPQDSNSIGKAKFFTGATIWECFGFTIVLLLIGIIIGNSQKQKDFTYWPALLLGICIGIIGYSIILSIRLKSFMRKQKGKVVNEDN